MSSPHDDEKAPADSRSVLGDETDIGTLDEKDKSDRPHIEEPNQTENVKDGYVAKPSPSHRPSRGSPNDNLDIEALGDDVGGIEKVATHGTRNSQTHRSVLSRLSRTISRKPKEKIPPPVLPTMDLDAGIVGWESQHDPEMPLNFTPQRKWTIVLLLSLITFMTPFASSILAPAITFISEDYDAGLTMSSMPVTIFLLGYAVGPLFLSPLSEIYGRSPVMLSATAFFCIWLIGSALTPSLEALIVFRFLTGVGGSACQTIGGAIVADVFPVSERGKAMTVWMMGPLVGPSIGPLIGGFVSQNIGWRYVNWITFAPATAAVICLGVFGAETNHRVLIQRKTRRLRVQLSRPDLRSCYTDPEVTAPSTRQILLSGLIRPINMLVRSAIVFSMSLYIAFVYGCLYLLFNTIPLVFQGSYGWDIGTTGLVYLSLLIGYSIGMALFSSMSDRTVVRMTNANGGVYEPEFRLPDCIWYAMGLPITFFWYGWAADKSVHWIVPIIGIVPFGISSVGVWMPCQSYLADAFSFHAASALAAFSVLRSTVAAFLPLAGPQMYESLGVGWGTSLLGFIAIALIPIPTLIYKYGKTMRGKYPLKL